MNIDEFNEALLNAVNNGDSSSVSKLLEHELINNWLDSDYSLNSNPFINPIIASMCNIDGKNTFKEFLNRYGDLMQWEFGSSGKEKISTISNLILYQNIDIIDYLYSSRHDEFMSELIFINKNKLTPMGYIGFADKEFINDFFSILNKTEKEDILEEKNDVILVSFFHSLFANNNNQSRTEEIIDNLLSVGINFKANNEDITNNMFLKLANFYANKNLKTEDSEFIQKDPFLLLLENDKERYPLKDKLNIINNIYNQENNDNKEYDYTLGLISSINLENFHIISDSILVNDKDKFYEGFKAGILNKLDYNLVFVEGAEYKLKNMLELKKLVRFKNIFIEIEENTEKPFFSDSILANNFLHSLLNQYTSTIHDVFVQKYKITKDFESDPINYANLKTTRRI